LSPSAMEERLGRSTLLDELLPMRRKARLWELYRRMHGSLSAESSQERTEGKTDARSGRASGVREIFNQAFTKAYEAEAARFRRSRQ
jgi:predicted component of type VI protein secretion system